VVGILKEPEFQRKKKTATKVNNLHVAKQHPPHKKKRKDLGPKYGKGTTENGRQKQGPLLVRERKGRAHSIRHVVNLSVTGYGVREWKERENNKIDGRKAVGSETI